MAHGRRTGKVETLMRRIWPLLLASVVAAALLLSLGFWQLRRLDEKQEMIAMLDQRLAATPVNLEEALQYEAENGDLEYLKVIVRGRYLGKAMFKLNSLNGQPAFELLQPFLTDANELLLVDRGAIPVEQANETWPVETDITGVLRKHDKGQGMFDAENDPRNNSWHWWDVEAMLATVPLPDGALLLPLVLQRVSQKADQGLPQSAVPKAELRNNHLGYAITWFGLAFVTMAMTAFLMLRRKVQTSGL
jgi:surfeit locus 1 family protein